MCCGSPPGIKRSWRKGYNRGYRKAARKAWSKVFCKAGGRIFYTCCERDFTCNLKL